MYIFLKIVLPIVFLLSPFASFSAAEDWITYDTELNSVIIYRMIYLDGKITISKVM